MNRHGYQLGIFIFNVTQLYPILEKTKNVLILEKTKHNQLVLMLKGDKCLQKRSENQFFVVLDDDI